MRSFALEVKEKDFTSMPKICSRYILGYKTIKGEPRYMVNVRGILSRTYNNFNDADKERRYILENII